jgi:hypothetical protein
MFAQWDWFVPVVQAQASAALGRAVTIGHLHVQLGRTIQITVDDVVVANPPNWTGEDPPFAAANKLMVQVKAWDYITGHGLMLPLISIERPSVFAAERADGTPNFQLLSGSSSNRPPPVIGDPSRLSRSHMWTAPSSQGVWQHFDQIACVHMSGLSMRSHMNVGQDGFRDTGSKQKGDL